MKRITGVAAAMLMVLGLAACGGKEAAQSDSTKTAEAAADQDVPAACAVVEEQMATIAQNYADVEQTSAEDPDAAVESLRSMTAELEAASPLITNKEVRLVWDKFIGAYHKMVEATESLDEETMLEAVTALTGSAQELSELCEDFVGQQS